MADDPAFFERQYRELRFGSGLVELPDWSSVTLTGGDRQKFLNSFCTNDVKRLGPGQNCEAFFCNVKGKIIGHGLVTCRDSELVVIGPPGQGAALASHLDRYVIREDVQVRDTTAERSYLLVAGGNSLGDKITDMACFPWRLVAADIVCLLEFSLAEVVNNVATLTARGMATCDRRVFDALRIEAGGPLYGVDFDDSNFPQEVGRDAEAISFIKGCYLGQETVARIDALGHVNQQIIGARFAGDVVPEIKMDLTYAGATVGHVTSATFSPALDRPLALAMVRREHNTAGSELESAVGRCQVVPLPVRPRPAAN